MATYNVLVAVVDLVEAATPEAAIAELRHRLAAAGFEVYDEAPADAFESEPLT